MSSGRAPIAHVEIEHGSVNFSEVWGDLAPDPARMFELCVNFTAHRESAGNVHSPAAWQGISVYLTPDELAALTDELTATRMRYAAADAARLERYRASSHGPDSMANVVAELRQPKE